MYKQASALLLLIAPPTSLFAEDLRVCDSLGDKGIETLQWSLGIIDQKLPKVPPAEAKALDELEARFNSQGLDGVPSPDLERDLRAARERGVYFVIVCLPQRPLESIRRVRGIVGFVCEVQIEWRPNRTKAIDGNALIL